VSLAKGQINDLSLRPVGLFFIFCHPELVSGSHDYNDLGEFYVGPYEQLRKSL
jgi:hypothetical protein